MTDREKEAREIAHDFCRIARTDFRKNPLCDIEGGHTFACDDLTASILAYGDMREREGLEACRSLSKGFWLTRERGEIGNAYIESALCEEIADAISALVTAHAPRGLSQDGGGE